MYYSSMASCGKKPRNETKMWKCTEIYRSPRNGEEHFMSWKIVYFEVEFETIVNVISTS